MPDINTKDGFNEALELERKKRATIKFLLWFMAITYITMCGLGILLGSLLMTIADFYFGTR